MVSDLDPTMIRIIPSFLLGKYRPMKDISIGGIVLLDRAELGAEDEEQV